MMRSLLGLVPWMVIGTATAQTGGPSPAEAVFTSAESQHIPAYRVGAECYAAVDALKNLGWDCSIGTLQAEVITPGGPVRVTYRIQGGKPVVPLGEIARRLGGDGAWRDGSSIFELYAVAKSVVFEGGRVLVESGMKFRPKANFLDGPPRLVLDFVGLRLAPGTKTILEGSAKVGQYKPNTARLVIPIGADRGAARTDFDATERFSQTLTSLIVSKPLVPAREAGSEKPAGPGTRGAPNPKTKPANTQIPPASPPKSDPSGPVQSGSQTISIEPPTTRTEAGAGDDGEILTQEEFDREPPVWNGVRPAVLTSMAAAGDSDAGAVIVLKVNGKLSGAPLFRRPESDVLEVILPGVCGGAQRLAAPSTRWVRSFSSMVREEGFVLRFELSGPLGMQISTPPGEVHLLLIQPKSGDGSLAGKVIVVDAGHGGADTGARSPDKSVLEKNLTLSIASLLADRLSREGATVVMTRKTDVFIPLKERPEVANRNGASFFVSVHINSNERSNSSSGGISFYHGRDPVSMLLAECVQAEIAKVSGFPSLGAWSDFRIYDTGFAVLRYSKMPAILIEMGFINNRTDRSAMVKAAFQQAAADAVVKGIKVYLGNGQE